MYVVIIMSYTSIYILYIYMVREYIATTSHACAEVVSSRDFITLLPTITSLLLSRYMYRAYNYRQSSSSRKNYHVASTHTTDEQKLSCNIATARDIQCSHSAQSTHISDARATR